MTAADLLLEVENLEVHFPIRKGFLSKIIGRVKAVDDVSLTLKRGETLGLVGESGCGKSTLGRAILKLIQPTAGSVHFEGQDLLGLDRSALRNARRRMRIVFQDPYSSLNPRMTVGQIVGEAFDIFGDLSARQRKKAVTDLLEVVGLRAEHIGRYPHEFSGGQRQRIGIARALALDPSLIVCDEPVSALDVSIQSQILNLFADLQERFNLAYLFISHDLKVVEFVSHRVAVMYLGRLVEIAPCRDLYRSPMHPYTKALLAASPIPDPEARRKQNTVRGEPPNPIDPPSGCAFHPRCPFVVDHCRAEMPPLSEHQPRHAARCWRVGEIAV